MATYDEQILGAKQQAELARKLRESATAPQGQMVSGWHVAPSPTQYAAELMKAYYGRQGETAAQDKLASILKERETKGNELLAQMPQTRTVPEQVTPTFDNSENRLAAHFLRGGADQQMPQANTTPQDPSMLSALIRGEQPQQMPMGNVPLPQQTGQTVTPAQTIVPTDVEKQQYLMKWQDIDPAKAQLIAKMMEMQAGREDKRDLLKMTMAEKQAEAERQRQFLAEQAKDRNANAMSIAQLGAQIKQQQSQQVKLNPTIEKEIFQADELANASQNTVSLLQQAKELNKQPTYSGYGATARATAANNMPAALGGQSKEASNTIQLNNMMTGQALESLKATFGGNPTEGERAILLELQASADKSPADREKIMDRAIAMANQRLKFHTGKAEQLRSGTYFQQGQNALPAPMQNPSQTTIKYDAQGNRVQ